MTFFCLGKAFERLAEMLSIEEGTDELLDFGDASWASTYWIMFEHTRPADETTHHPQLLHRVTISTPSALEQSQV